MSLDRVRKVSALVCLAACVGSACLGFYFTQHRPEAPDPASGATHYYKGVLDVVYLTDAEAGLMNVLFLVALVAGLVAVALTFFPRRVHDLIEWLSG